MYEKLIEHWLTNVNELGFQLPLCEALLAQGYSILHVSRHGRGELYDEGRDDNERARSDSGVSVPARTLPENGVPSSIVN